MLRENHICVYLSKINETVNNRMKNGYKIEVRMDTFSNNVHTHMSANFAITTWTGAWTLDSRVTYVYVYVM